MSHQPWSVPLDGDEGGYSMVELAVVLLVVGILVAVGIPMHLRAARRAEDAAAQSDLRDAVVTAHVHEVGAQSFLAFDPAVAESLEPSIPWEPAGPPSVGSVAIVGVSDTTVQLVARSASGTYFCLMDNTRSVAASSLTFGAGGSYEEVDEPAECSAASW
ncbi:MAG: hypothetical protein HY658_13230 [Actinobacteria bacterium]|nr:hypothetical protein [Actinomycetota bacterium]